eukprot:scaffold28261_cov112-Isochrysis_galbana.AAC.5
MSVCPKPPSAMLRAALGESVWVVVQYPRHLGSPREGKGKIRKASAQSHQTHRAPHNTLHIDTAVVVSHRPDYVFLVLVPPHTLLLRPFFE